MARRLVLWTLLLTTILGALGAEDWRVAIISLSPKADLVLPLITNSAERFGAILTPTVARQAHYQEKIGREVEAAYREERSRLYAAGDAEAIRGLKRESIGTVELPTTITYTTMAYERERADLLASQEGARTWYQTREGFDALITLSVQEIDSFDRVVCTIVEGGSQPVIDRLVERGAFHLLADSFDEALLGFSGAMDRAALLVEGGPPSMRIAIDGVPQTMGQRLFILPPSPLMLSLSSPSHQGREMALSLKAGRVTTIDGTLEEVRGGPVTVRSESGAVQWFVDGISFGTSISLGLDSVTFPLTILATKRGFAPMQLALLSEGEGEVTFMMEGEPMRSTALLEREQEDFYKALRSTILLFGAYVATLALGNTAGLESGFWPIAQVASGALAAVNLVSLFAHLATYAR